MTPDYRALCAELVEAWDATAGCGFNEFDHAAADIVDRARALLAQPVAEGPTDEEIEEWADACPEAPLEEMDPEVHGWRRCFTAKEFSETIRAALARWGRPTPQPVAVSERLQAVEALAADAVSGLRYIEQTHGRLYGVGWDRVFDAAAKFLPANALPTPDATNDY